MPRQNRVTPFSAIVAYPERGTFTGNRGILHDAQGRLIGRQWTTTRWIICLLEFKGRKRVLMTPGHYTELFFLDEATALAAGHRPCRECRRADHDRFKHYWLLGNPDRLGEANPGIDAIDRALHEDRVEPRTRRKKTYQADLAGLPDGTFVVLEDETQACLVWGDRLWEWSPGGYVNPIARPASRTVTILTPRSIVNTLAAGYVPTTFGIQP
jgi:hypothetical protein